jgi:VIT1/CCC1 family predicted Fe2+/Mn2+ transporter
MSELKDEQRTPVLDPTERASEIIFGLIMALTFTGTLSATTSAREEIRTMLFAALGCNLAWGLVDAVMYLIGILTDRARNLNVLRRVHSTSSVHEAHTIIARALPGRLSAAIGAEGLESMRQHITALPELPAHAHLGRDDYIGAFGVFLLVVLATFPVVLPFMLISETMLAMRVSNAVALVTLFAAGYMLGRHADVAPWRSGFAMAAIGAFLVAVTMALGG